MDEREPATRPTVWVVSRDGTERDGPECEHPGETLRRVGDDGRNTYYQCEQCEAVLVAQDELVRAATGAAGGPETTATADGEGAPEPEAPG